MKTARAFHPFAGLLPAALLAACFTEVGNPDAETAMTASVRIDYATLPGGDVAGPDSVTLSFLRLRLLGASWMDADSAEHALWPSQAGRDLDFAGGDTLPRAKLSGSAPRKVSIRLGRSPGADFVTGAYAQGGTLRNFRFALPDTTGFSIEYDGDALEAWRTGREYACRFEFLARAWLAVPGLDTAAAFPDGAGGELAIFDAERNPDLHRALLQEFSHAFNGPRAYPKQAKDP